MDNKLWTKVRELLEITSTLEAGQIGDFINALKNQDEELVQEIIDLVAK